MAHVHFLPIVKKNGSFFYYLSMAIAIYFDRAQNLTIK